MYKTIITALTLTFILGCAKPQATFDTHLQVRFKIFTTAVGNAAIAMEIAVPKVELLDRMFVVDKAQVAGYTQLDPLTNDGVGYGIHISKSFLVNPPMILEHVAAHEVCHFYFDVNGLINTETLAEKCVFEYEGETRFMVAYTYLYETEGMAMPSVEQVKEFFGVK